MDGVTLPKAVFFDWDGTLVDTFLFLHEAHNHVRGVFGIGAFTVEDFRGYFGKPRELLYAEIYGPQRIEEAKGHFEAFVIENGHRIQMMPGAKDLIAAIRSTDIPMGIVTNKKGALVRKEIENHGWGDVFVSVVGAGEAEADKPSSAPLLLAIAQSGLDVSPQDVWYVGDTDNDIKCGKNAGAMNVFITNNEDHSDLIAEYAPEMVFKDCTEFKDFLLQSAGNSLQKNANTA